MTRHDFKARLLRLSDPEVFRGIYTLDEIIADAVGAVRQDTEDSHIYKDDELLNEYGHTHMIDMTRCWCDPITVYTDPINGHKVFLHRTLEA